MSKCPYCDFRSAVLSSMPEREYTESLLKELYFVTGKEGLEKRPLDSIYIGGGTPSLFSPSSISKVVSSIKGLFIPADALEVTLEVNPDTVDREKLEGFFNAGVNRLSIGAQSLNDRELQAIGRTHSAERAVGVFKEARAAGFENIGLDAIFGLPGQSVEDFIGTLEKFERLRPEHISVYGLTIEEGTRFHKLYGKERRPEGLLPLPDEDEEAGMYGEAIRLLTSSGWEHYEVSNFALPGFRSVHNGRYWHGLDYIGLGVSAHSYLSYPSWGRRWWNENTASKYMDRIEKEGAAVCGMEELTREEALTESLMLGLRLINEGVEVQAFKERFGLSTWEAFPNLKILEKEGFVKATEGNIVLTGSGLLLSNEVFLRILAGC